MALGRHGTDGQQAASVFHRAPTVRVIERAVSKDIGQLLRRHRTTEFLKFLSHPDLRATKRGEVHVVMDNYGIRKAPREQRSHPLDRCSHARFPSSALW